MNIEVANIERIFTHTFSGIFFLSLLSPSRCASLTRLYISLADKASDNGMVLVPTGHARVYSRSRLEVTLRSMYSRFVQRDLDTDTFNFLIETNCVGAFRYAMQVPTLYS